MNADSEVLSPLFKFIQKNGRHVVRVNINRHQRYLKCELKNFSERSSARSASGLLYVLPP
jgi:bifunctional pyridoxal-dependent enzyme with beta-cystathionase and maltose regulon repressor activities